MLACRTAFRHCYCSIHIRFGKIGYCGEGPVPDILISSLHAITLEWSEMALPEGLQMIQTENSEGELPFASTAASC